MGKEGAIQGDRHAIEFGGQSRDSVLNPARSEPATLVACPLAAVEHVLVPWGKGSGLPAPQGAYTVP